MEIAIFIAAFLIIAVGFFAMDGIDKNMNEIAVNDVHKQEETVDVIIYGECQGLISYLIKKKISYIYSKDNEIPIDKKAVVVFAMSNKDLENLLFCVKAKYMFPVIKTFGKCNDTIYKDIFERSGVDEIITGTLSDEKINFYLGKAGLI